jgi:hypothetical protein
LEIEVNIKSEPEILGLLKESFPDAEKYTITPTAEGVDLEISRMYEYVTFNAESLFKLCEFFDTMNVSDSRYSYGGCETCDYGSKYEVTLHVRPGKPFPATNT